MGRWNFLKEKKFYLNLLIILILCVVLLWLTFKLLDGYTRHDKVFTMPDFVGQNFNQVKHDHSKDFNFIVIDSVYPKGLEPGSIHQQDPLPGSKIKKGRNVYAIVVAVTPEPTEMPDVKGTSLRAAVKLLESEGLEVDHLEYVTSYPYTKNIAGAYFQGSPIEKGTKLIRGDKIVLKVGLGSDRTKEKVPNLIGKPAEETKRTLNSMGFNLGNVVFEDNDSIQYQCVKRMSPGPSSGLVKLGTYVDVWYHSNRTLDFKKEMNELLHEDSVTNNPKPIVIDTVIEKETIETTDYEEQDEFEDDF